MDYIKRNDIWVPKLGFGTFNLRGRQARGVLEFALDVGYRHFDTAQMYENEEVIGEVLAKSDVPRDRLFITTKVWHTHLGKDRFMEAVKRSLEKLRLKYVDLLLIHWPNREIPLEESLELLQQAQQDGLTQLIGVSNFNAKLLDRVAAEGVAIDCNQIENHVFLDQSALIRKTRQMGAFVTSYCPIARGQTQNEPVLKRIAKVHKVSATQVALRWLVQQEDVVAIPKSSQLIRIKKNFDVFNFTLSEEEIEAINVLKKRNLRLIDPEFAPTWDQ